MDHRYIHHQVFMQRRVVASVEPTPGRKSGTSPASYLNAPAFRRSLLLDIKRTSEKSEWIRYVVDEVGPSFIGMDIIFIYIYGLIMINVLLQLQSFFCGFKMMQLTMPRGQQVGRRLEVQPSGGPYCWCPLFRAGAQNNIRGKWWFNHHILGLFLGKAVKAKYHKMCIYIYTSTWYHEE